MVATHTNTLMVYKDAVLKWAAQLQHTPVHLEICHMGYEYLEFIQSMFIFH